MQQLTQAQNLHGKPWVLVPGWSLDSYAKAENSENGCMLNRFMFRIQCPELPQGTVTVLAKVQVFECAVTVEARKPTDVQQKKAPSNLHASTLNPELIDVQLAGCLLARCETPPTGMESARRQRTWRCRSCNHEIRDLRVFASLVFGG